MLSQNQVGVATWDRFYDGKHALHKIIAMKSACVPADQRRKRVERLSLYACYVS